MKENGHPDVVNVKKRLVQFIEDYQIQNAVDELTDLASD